MNYERKKSRNASDKRNIDNTLCIFSLNGITVMIKIRVFSRAKKLLCER